jgi:mannose-1-phosphate guanylyltransferase
MAGGAGKRLWPMSRLDRPKQLLPLVGGENLLSISVDRLKGVMDEENILIVTNAEYADQVAESLPGLPRENIIGEPEGRDTANAIALAAELLAARDESATMSVFTADHVIRPQERFARSVTTACEAAETHPDALVTFGIRPTWPHTGLGYIHCDVKGGGPAYEVLGFREKPDHPTARRYVDSGEYYWNSGMFVWTLQAIRKALGEFLPGSMEKLAAVRKAATGGKNYQPILEEVYPTLEKISIDYAVMEKAREVMMVELDCEWVDVGSWPALERVCPTDEKGNVVMAENAVLAESSRNVVVTETGHIIGVVGMEDCIVVHTPDATLVCKKSDAQRIKGLVGEVADRFGSEHV